MPEQIVTADRMQGIKDKRGKFDFRTIFPFLGLLFVLILFGIMTKGSLFSKLNLKAVLNDGIYVMIGTVGFLFLFAQGALDFSVGANMATSCAVAAIAANSIGPGAALPAALLTGTAIGIINGLVYTKLRISAFITTLSGMFILQGLVLVILDGSVLAAPISMLKWFTNPLKLTILMAVLIIGYIMFQYTPYGKICKSIGSCPEAVRQTGINLDFYRAIPFVTMGLLVGMLAFLSLIRTGSATNNTGGTLMFNVLNAALLGGLPMSGGPTTKFRGAIVGSLTIAFLVSGMTIMGIETTDQQIVKGIVFLIAIGISFDRKNMKIIK